MSKEHLFKEDTMSGTLRGLVALSLLVGAPAWSDSFDDAIALLGKVHDRLKSEGPQKPTQSQTAVYISPIFDEEGQTKPRSINPKDCQLVPVKDTNKTVSLECQDTDLEGTSKTVNAGFRLSTNDLVLTNLANLSEADKDAG